LNSLHERIYNTGRRVQAFLDANDSLLNNINKSGMRSELDTVVLSLGQFCDVLAQGRTNRSPSLEPADCDSSTRVERWCFF
jgi:hypothetical protein